MIFHRRLGGKIGPVTDQLIKDQENTPTILWGRVYDGKIASNDPTVIETGRAEVQMERIPLQVVMIGYLAVVEEGKDIDTFFKSLPVVNAASRETKLNIVRLVLNDFLQSINKEYEDGKAHH